ncbi:MAG TPA: hypothetical protein VK001_08280 [Geminicoccaceae bacterium]|nr:hypothetical protein [Geminicoccaceae bacterium]
MQPFEQSPGRGEPCRRVPGGALGARLEGSDLTIQTGELGIPADKQRSQLVALTHQLLKPSAPLREFALQLIDALHQRSDVRRPSIETRAEPRWGVPLGRSGTREPGPLRTEFRPGGCRPVPVQDRSGIRIGIASGQDVVTCRRRDHFDTASSSHFP